MLPVQAASCAAGTATVTQTSSPVFYVDDPTYNYGYVSYQVATGASGSFNDMWVKVDGFTNTSLLGLAGSEDGLYHVGALGANSTTNVYFFLKGAITTSAQSYILHLYDGKPGAGGAETCSSTQSNTAVTSTIQSSNNTVSSVSYTAPYIGSTFTATVIGDTGTIGSAGIFSYTPASQGTWNADCLELKGTSITMSGGNTGTFTNGLYKSGLSSSTTHYTIAYTFTAKCVTSTTTPVVPLSYISSGTQIKHTSVANYGSLPPIAPATNALVMTKSVNPASSTSGGTTTYHVNVTNNGPSTATLDDFTDVLPSSPANVSYNSATSTYDTDISDATAASAISNPSISGQTLTWVRSFSVPSGKTAQLSYQVTIPSNTGRYVNSAVAHSGSAQIDQTADTTDNMPATAVYGVGSLSLAGSTKTASDINGGSLQPGDIIEYTINAVASGTQDATGVHIADTIDTNTNALSNVVVGASATDCGSSYSDNSTSTALDITGVNIAHGTTCTVTFRVMVKSSAASGTTILNSATITASEAGSISGNPSSAPMVVHKDPILSVTNVENDADNVVTANQVITYTATITNTGQAAANGVDVSGTITGPVGSLSSRTLTNCGSAYVDTSSSLSITIAALAVTTASPCVITYTVTVNSGATSGSIMNTIDATAAREGGNDPAAVSASTLLIGAAPTPPNLAVSVNENDADGRVTPGQTVTYTGTITNSGQTDATTSLTSAIPTGMGAPGTVSYTNCGSPSSSFSSPTLTITNISIPAANICSFSFSVQVNSPLDENTALTLGVDVAAASQGGNNPANVNATTLTVDATPILDVSFSENDADNMVAPSQDIAYTLTITNSGNGTATIVGALDNLIGPAGNPSNFSFSNCGSSYTNNSNASFNAVDLTISVTTPCIVTYHVSVNSNATTGQTIANSIDVSAASEGGENPIPVAASTLTVSALPNLSVTSSENDADTIITPGQNVTYTTRISNDGTGMATGVGLADTFTGSISSIGSFSFTNCGSSYTNSSSGNTVSIIGLQVTAGDSCTIVYHVTASSSAANGSTITNSADVTAATQGGNDPVAVSASTLTVDAAPALSVTSGEDDADNTVIPGQDITYTITLTNNGSGIASGIGMTDPVSGAVGTVNTVGFSNCGSSYTNNSSGVTLRVVGITVAASSSCVITFHVSVSANAPGGSTITDSADATAATEGGNNPAAVSATVLTVATIPVLDVTVDDNDTDNIVTPAQSVVFTVTIANSGNGTAHTSGVVTVPSGVGSPTSIQTTHCGSANTAYGSPTLSLSNLTITTADACVITFTVAVSSPSTDGATFALSADIAAASEGGNDPAAETSSTFTVNTTPNLSTSTYVQHDTDGGTLKPGDTLDYTLTVINTGDGAASGVSLLNAMPASVVFDPATISMSNCGTSITDNSTAAGLDIVGLAINTDTHCVITFSATVRSPLNEGTAIASSVSISAASEGGSGASSLTGTLFTDATPNLSTSSLAASDLNGGTFKPGDTIGYTLTIKNTGDGGATGVAVSQTLNAHMLLDTSSFTFTNCGSSITNTSSASALALAGLQIAVGTHCVVYFEATAASPLDEGTSIGATVAVASATQGGLGASTGVPAFTIDATPQLGVALTDDDDDNTVSLGQIINMQAAITNHGDGTASGVSFDYTLGAPGKSLSDITTTGCGSSLGQNNTATTVHFDNLTIAAGATCRISFVFTVDAHASDGATIEQSVDVGAASEGGNDPAAVQASTLQVNASNAAPNTPTDVTSDILSGNHQLGAGGLNGASLSATLSDPDNTDQLRYRIQIASDGGFTTPAIDYRSALANQGTRQYTYQENTGTYLVGSSALSLPDGNYYARIRAEDQAGASSAWYTLPGIAFTYDTTPPVQPSKPFLVGPAGVGTATIGWDASSETDLSTLIPYRLEDSSDAGFTTSSDLDAAALSAYFTALPKGAHHYFRLYARDIAGNLSLPSDVLDVYIPGEVVGGPTSTPTTFVPKTKSEPVGTDSFSSQQSKGSPRALKTVTIAPIEATLPTTAKAPPADTTTIIITVRDAAGRLVKGAKVTLHSTPRVGYTDKNGQVVYRGVPIGRHTVTVEYKGQTASTPLALKQGTAELRVALALRPATSRHDVCWLWWLLLLVIVWLYYRHRVRRTHRKVSASHKSLKSKNTFHN